jgi:hypothetical protein
LFVRAIGREETWVLVISALCVALVSLAWPSTFLCTPSVLVRTLWWRPRMLMPWGDIVQVERTAGGDLNVYDTQGRCLCFSRFHVDPRRFESEVLRRSNLKAAIAASELTSLR